MFDAPFSEFFFSAALLLILADLERLFSLLLTIENKVEFLFSSTPSNFDSAPMFFDLKDRPTDFIKLNQELLEESISISSSKSSSKPASPFRKRARKEEKSGEREKKMRKSDNGKKFVPTPTSDILPLTSCQRRKQ